MDIQSFGAALIGQRIEALNPMNGVMADLMRKQVAEAEDELISKTSKTIEMIEAKLEAAKARSASASVIGAYEKLLARAEANI